MAFYYDGLGRIKQNYPEGKVANRIGEKPLYTIELKERQHLVAVGQTTLIDYYYLVADSISRREIRITPRVTDKHGALLTENNLNQPPEDGTLDITLPWDGFIDVFQGEQHTDRKQLKSNNTITVSNINRDTTLKIYCGCDCIRTIFIQSKENHLFNESVLLQQLQCAKGRERAIPHSMGWIFTQWADCPNIVAYIRKCIRKGMIPQDELQLLIDRKKE